MGKLSLQLICNLPKKPKEQISYKGTLSKQDAMDFFNISNNIEKYKDKLCYLFGNTNTQKTIMATLLGYELIEKGQSIKYITLWDLLSTLCNFNLTEKQEATKNDLYDCSFLILDDFNGDYIKGFSFTDPSQILYNFIKIRCNVNLKNIIFISQHNIDENNLSSDIRNYIKTNLRISELNNIKSVFCFRDDYLKYIDTNFNMEEFYRIKQDLENTKRIRKSNKENKEESK